MDMPREDKSELYMKALDYAKANSLDINNLEDVKKIAEAVDPNHTSDQELQELKYQLTNATMFLNITGAKNK